MAWHTQATHAQAFGRVRSVHERKQQG